MTRRPNTTTALSPFATDVSKGLDQNPPRISSKWFYDERGNELFHDIMRAPEYYLTNAETEIYRNCGPDLARAVGKGAFDLIELGAGDGSKTRLLIEFFLSRGLKFTYRPVDLNAAAIDELRDLVSLNWPTLPFEPVQSDYFEALSRLGASLDGQRRLVLFPGANIGNYPPESAIQVLKSILEFLTPTDLLMTGFDLKKDPATILAAYNDAGGCTAAFNLNLLTRMNRELGANFDLERWRHWESYDPSSGAARSYLVCDREQKVRIRAIDRTYTFYPWQAIQVEISQKYSLSEIEDLAKTSGFKFVRHFLDARSYFANSLWRVAGS